MKRTSFSVICILAAIISQAQILPELIDQEPFSIGKSLTIGSNILEEERIINIYLPQNYSKDSSKTYPVIYLLDGSKDEDFIHISGLVQFGSFPWIKMVPESIVVGIANVDRKRDFTSPSENKLDQTEFPSSGHAQKFIQFIAQELQPFVEAQFKTSQTKTIIGQSLGGLLATEILFKAPHLFNHYIIVSPSLWWNDEKILEAKPKSFRQPTSIYIAVGKEGAVMERTAKTLYDRISMLHHPEIDVAFEYLEDKSHGDALHIATYNALEYFFKSKNEE